MNNRSKNLTKMTLLYEDESKDSEFSTSRETEKSKRRRRRRGRRRGGFKPWDVSSESTSSAAEITEEEEEEEEPEEILIFDLNEDEFACEEVEQDAEPVVIRRARTAKKTEGEIEEVVVDDKPCKKCGKHDKPEWILLCDKCDGGYHTHCLIPPLMIVPDGDWFCQPCEHMFLCQCLQDELYKLEVILKQREREALRKQRLAYVGISLDNVLKPDKKEDEEETKSVESFNEDTEKEEEDIKTVKVKEPKVKEESSEDERHKKLYAKRSVRARRNVNYQFKEYDELIASALQEEIEVKLPESVYKEDDEKDEDASDAGSDKPFTARISKRKRKSRSFRDLDDFSDEDDSGDDYKGGSTDSEATAPRSKSSEPDSHPSDAEWGVKKTKPKARRKPRRQKPKNRRRRRRGGSSEEEEEEDWSDEELDSDNQRPITRRSAAQKAISYREISSEDEDEWKAKSKPSKRRKSTSSSAEESESSFKKKVTKKKRIKKWGSSDSEESEEQKSMSSSQEESEDDDKSEDSERQYEIKKVEKMRLKESTNKKVLSSEEEEEEEEDESSTQDSVPKKKLKKVAPEESEEEEEEEEDDDEEEEEEEEDSEYEEESDDDEPKKIPSTEKKVSSENKIVAPEKHEDGAKATAEKLEIPSENKEAGISAAKISVSGDDEKLIAENKDLQPQVLIRKEPRNPLEPVKDSVKASVISKYSPKTVRKEATKMVPCVIPYEKSSPKSGHSATLEEESDKEPTKDSGNTMIPALVNRPMHYPNQVPPPLAPLPSSRIQYGHPMRSLGSHHGGPVRPPPPPHPANRMPPRLLPHPSMQVRPPVGPGNVPMRHTRPPSHMPHRPSLSSNMPVRPSPSSSMPGRPSPSSSMPGRPGSSHSVPGRPSPSGNVPASPISSKGPPAQSVQSKPDSKPPYKSTIMEPFEENDSDDEVPLERIPTACVPTALTNRPVSYEREAEYRPAAKELSTFNYAPAEEKSFPSTYSPLAPFQDYSARPSPLKPSLVETYPNNSSPSKLTSLDTYSRSNSPKGFISLDSYSENKKKKHFYGGNSAPEAEGSSRPPRSSSDNYQGGEIRFPPEPYPCPQSPNTYRSPPPAQRDPGTPPRLYSQFPDAYAPPRSPEYYQNHQYYASEERIPRPSYQPNYAPPEPPSFVSNPYVATPVPQPNGGFMIDTLLRARNPENEEDELTGVTDIVSYITQE